MSDDLREIGRAAGWFHQRLTANGGKVRSDYFSRAPGDGIHVRYLPTGAIVAATLTRHGRGGVATIEHLGSKDVDKRSTVIAWFNQHQSK